MNLLDLHTKSLNDKIDILKGRYNEFYHRSEKRQAKDDNQINHKPKSIEQNPNDIDYDEGIEVDF